MKLLVIVIASIMLFSCSSTEAKSYTTIFNNQVGYITEGDKYFIVTENVGAFKVIDKNSKKVVYKGKIKKGVKRDSASGLNTYIGDFSKLKKNGEFYIELDNGTKSLPFKIDPEIYNSVRDISLKSFYFQRSGIELEEKYAGKFKRPAGHLDNLEYHPSSPITGFKDVSGGWYDAGDFGRYIIPASVSLGIMLTGYEQYPEKFNFDNNNIPESGNGVSDFLDEMRYELEWMLKMQNLEQGDFFGALPYMVNSKIYVWEMPHVGSQKQYIYDFSSVATGTFTAVMAQSSRVFKNIDNDFSNKCLEAAINSWSFLEKNGNYPKNGFKKPQDTVTGGYAENPKDNFIDSDDRLWAAVQLYLATGDSKYQEYIDSNIEVFHEPSWNMAWTDTLGFAKISYILGLEKGYRYRDELFNDFISYCDDMMQYIYSDGFRTALRPNDYFWGSNGEVLNRSLLLILAYNLTGEKDYYNGALYQLNYVLGLNPKQRSYVVGFGSVYPKNIHHAITGSDSVDGSFPGLIAGGANSRLLGDQTLPRYFNEKTPPALCYIDHIDSWASNENCIIYNAPLIPVSAFFSN